MLGIILGIIFIILVGFFAVCSCIVSSGCSRYEEYHRENDVNGSRKTKE